MKAHERHSPVSLVLTVAVLLLGCVAFAHAGEAQKPPLRVAVLDLQTPQTSPWLGPAVSESLVAKLAGMDGLTLIEREQMHAILLAKQDREPTPELLGADFLITGSIQLVGAWPDRTARIRLATKLIASGTAELKPDAASVVDGTVEQLFALESDLADRLARSMGLEPTRLQMNYREDQSAKAKQLFGEGLLALQQAESASATGTDRNTVQPLLQSATRLFRQAQDANEGAFFARAHRYEARARELLATIQQDDDQRRRMRDETIRLFRQDAADAAPAFFDLALAYHANAHYQDATDAVAQYLRWASESSRLKSWEFVYPRSSRPEILTGARVFYFITPVQARYEVAAQRFWEDIGVIDRHPPIRESETRNYDERWMYACMDLSTGACRWVRSTDGRFQAAVDPVTDDLYLWRNRLVRLKAADGETALEKTISFDASRLSHLILDDGRIITAAGGLQVQAYTGSHDKVQSALRVDLLVEQAVDGAALLPWMRSRDGKRRIERRTELNPKKRASALVCLAEPPPADVLRPQPLGRRAAGGKEQPPAAPSLVPLWKHPCLDLWLRQALWIGADVLVLCGEFSTKCRIERLAGDTGATRWRFETVGGVLKPRDNWVPLGKLGRHIVVLNGQGGLLFLDPATGRLDMTFGVQLEHLHFPVLDGDRLVVFGEERSWAVPLDGLRHPRAVQERDGRMLQARCAAAMGNDALALELIDELLRQRPYEADAWSLRAELCARLGQSADEVTSRCKVLALTGKENDPVLSARYGLHKRLPLPSDAAPSPHLVDDLLVLGTKDGTLVVVDTHSATVRERRALPSSVVGVHQIRAGVVQAYFENRQEEVVVNMRTSHAFASGFRPQRRQTIAWGAVSGYDGPPVDYRGKLYMPCGGGDIRIIDEENRSYETRKTSMQGIESWQILLQENMRLGYGSGGIYQLNDDLVPVDYRVKLWTTGGLNGIEPWRVWSLALHSNTIAFTCWDPENRRGWLEIWDRNLARRLRRVEIYEPFDLSPDPLIVAGDGYFLAGRELLWVPIDASSPVWRFDNSRKYTRHYRSSVQRYYDRPILSNGLIFMSCRDGGLYVFDVRAFATTATASDELSQ